MEKVFIVQTSFSDREEAVDFTRKILHERLAACVQLAGEVESFYWWKGTIEQEREVIVTMKTLESVLPKLEAYIETAHPYETPEILAVSADRVGSGYLEWLWNEMSTGGK